MKRFSVALTIAAALSLAACEKKIIISTDTTTSAATSAVADVTVPALRSQWKSFSGWVAQAAEMMPEADYAYKPIKTVRSFGEIVAHVAGTQNLICAAALDEPQPAEDAIEKGTHTKAELVAAIKQSNEHCAKAYDISLAAASGEITLFGEKYTKFAALTLNATHDGEHYGNIVTYMRMKGMVPPSSTPAPAAVVPATDTTKK